MAYKKKELIERLVKFKDEYGRLPSHSDFKAGQFSPSKNVYYRHFGSIEEAAKQAEAYERGELEFEDEAEISKVRSGMKKDGFRCRFCGGRVSNSVAYYSQLTDIIIHRFIDLLDLNNKESHYQGVLDSIYAVFYSENPYVLRELAKSGHLENFVKRHTQSRDDSNGG